MLYSKTKTGKCDLFIFIAPGVTFQTAQKNLCNKYGHMMLSYLLKFNHVKV